MVLNRTGYILILGMCDGDHAIAQAVRDVLAGDLSERAAAEQARIARSTLRGLVVRVRASLRKMIESGAVEARELVENSHVAV